MLTHFEDSEGGAFFSTAHDYEVLVNPSPETVS